MSQCKFRFHIVLTLVRPYSRSRRTDENNYYSNGGGGGGGGYIGYGVRLFGSASGSPGGMGRVSNYSAFQ